MSEGKTSRAVSGTGPSHDTGWIRHDRGQVYRVEVHLKETGGRWHANAATLANVTGEGPTEQEALEALTKQLAVELGRHKRAGGKIPWVEAPAPPSPTLVRCVFVTPSDHTNGQAEGRVVKSPGVCGGDACVRGTRLAVWGLEQWRRLGWDDARFLDAYPQLTREDLIAAWDYVQAHKDEIEQAIRENEEA